MKLVKCLTLLLCLLSDSYTDVFHFNLSKQDVKYLIPEKNP